MTNQDVLNTVWKHFIVGNECQNSNVLGCYYQPVKNNVGCFIGACMTPEMRERFKTIEVVVTDEESEDHYSPTIQMLFEGSDPLFQEVARHFDGCTQNFLMEMQRVHDDGDDKYYWKESLTFLAKKYNLSIPQ